MTEITDGSASQQKTHKISPVPEIYTTANRNNLTQLSSDN